jgi:hypothetical protein
MSIEGLGGADNLVLSNQQLFLIVLNRLLLSFGLFHEEIHVAKGMVFL